MDWGPRLPLTRALSPSPSGPLRHAYPSGWPEGGGERESPAADWLLRLRQHALVCIGRSLYPAAAWGVGIAVSDIFISYAREDRALAQALANDLQARGYSVWWDIELVGADDFQDVILAALAKARAAIVIWTKASV